jgi:hypothetical protein
MCECYMHMYYHFITTTRISQAYTITTNHIIVPDTLTSNYF